MKILLRNFSLGICLVTALSLFGIPTVAQQSERANFFFDVRVKVEGNIAAINTGVDLVCEVLLFDALGMPSGNVRSIINIVPAGEIFVPQTPEGFISALMMIPNLPVDLETAGPDLRNLGWNCFVTPAGTAEGFNGFASSGGFVSAAGTAIAPATVGTCARAFGRVSLESEVYDTELSCATN